MANYPQELAQDAVCQSHTGHMTGLWFLPTRPLRLNTNEWMNILGIWTSGWIFIDLRFGETWCVYDDVSNQQDATNSVYWSFYWSIWICSTCFGRQTRPSSGALLTVYTAFGTMYRYCYRPVGSNIDTLYQKLYIQSKMLLKMGKFVARNM